MLVARSLVSCLAKKRKALKGRRCEASRMDPCPLYLSKQHQIHWSDCKNSFRILQSRQYASTAQISPLLADPDLVRGGRLIAWLSFNKLGLRSLQEFINLVSSRHGSPLQLPRELSWCTPFVFPATSPENYISK